VHIRKRLFLWFASAQAFSVDGAKPSAGVAASPTGFAEPSGDQVDHGDQGDQADSGDVAERVTASIDLGRFDDEEFEALLNGEWGVGWRMNELAITRREVMVGSLTEFLESVSPENTC
jgi:hypothetical protein